MQRIAPCPNCDGNNIYLNKPGVSGGVGVFGGGAANYLPGLGGSFRFAKLYPAICKDCGLIRFFTDEDARSKLENSPGWEKQ
jgi:hypothetical protein